MHILLGGVHVVLLLFLLLLLFRWAMDLVLLISQTYRPSGAIASVLEVTYSVTDPPLRFLRRFIPPVRIGSVSLDLSFAVLMLGVWILLSVLP